MHDPTEGGLAAGLNEMAEASGVRVRVDLSSVLWFSPRRAICDALAADPMATLASGALLAAFPPDRAGPAMRALARHGYAASDIGRAGKARASSTPTVGRSPGPNATRWSAPIRRDRRQGSGAIGRTPHSLPGPMERGRSSGD